MNHTHVLCIHVFTCMCQLTSCVQQVNTEAAENKKPADDTFKKDGDAICNPRSEIDG